MLASFSSILSHSLVLKHNRHLERDVYDYIKANNLSSLHTEVPDLPFAYSKSRSGTDWSTPDGSLSDLGNRIGIQHIYCYQRSPLPPGFADSPECLARPYFVWGFSSVLLHITLSLQLVWTFGMFIVWLDANVYSKLCRKGRKTRGSFRNALDLAEAIKEVLGDDLCAYSNGKIARQLAKSGHGVRFYSTKDTKDAGISHIGLSSFTDGQRLQLDNCLYGGLDRSQE